jgi:hypothetical protein
MGGEGCKSSCQNCDWTNLPHQDLTCIVGGYFVHINVSSSFFFQELMLWIILHKDNRCPQQDFLPKLVNTPGTAPGTVCGWVPGNMPGLTDCVVDIDSIPVFYLI